MSGTTSNIGFRAASRRCRSENAQAPRSSRLERRRLARQSPRSAAAARARSSARRSGRSARGASRRRRDWRTERTKAEGASPARAMARRGGGDGDRIGDALRPGEADRSGSQSQAARAARTKAAPCAVVSSRRSAESASATGEFVDFRERRPVGGGRRAKACANSIASRRGAPNGQRSASQAASERASPMSPALDRPFESVRIGEGADRERRRQPEQQRQHAASPSVRLMAASPRWSPAHSRHGELRAICFMVMAVPMVVPVVG